MSNNCILCINTKSKRIKIFGRRGRELEIAKILSQHFWFSLDESTKYPEQICIICWRKTKSFNQFYKTVQDAYLNIPVQIKEDCLEPIIDPLDCQSNLSSGVKHNYDNYNEIDMILSGESHVKAQEDHDNVSIQIKQENVEPIINPLDFQANGNSETENYQNYIIETRGETDVKVKNFFNQFYKSVQGTHLNIPVDIKKEYVELINPIDCQSDSFADVENICDNYEADVDLNSKTYDKDFVVFDESEMVKRYAEDFGMECDLCTKQLNSLEDIQLHFKVQHNIKKGFVKCCGKKLTMRKGIVEHVSWHSNPNIFRCTRCPKKFQETRTLTRHILRRHNDDVTFSCNICDKRFSRQRKLNAHLNRDHQPLDQIFTCDICQRNFKYKRYLHKHMQIHTDTQHACDICFKVKPTRGALRSHKFNVHGEAKHQCVFCEKAFTQSVSLREHVATHTGKDLYSCPYCPKKFKSSANMYKHQKQVHLEQLTAKREQRKLTIIGTSKSSS